ncbi:hypothetical protein HMPREF1984_01317 [Leptotrichia sp. oral taxon 215 str. W9775]|jgi:regulatory protein YycH of two-component signal transduction system YycFG|uniref:hypothetical protein n=1 Tax=Leptotrichia sp. oral taxon 215 TaxID=712359 RepID=UPI0003AE6D42|nr:hypothetical protein [Leptotrichia sp. oral taxon 215]ERK67013.1 hypothetical protein HMPREF1984_01317 [Leptotrichia sp. oral taxon 215 str. W9775]
MITVQEVIEIRKINKILDKIEFCKKNTTKVEIKLFLMSIEQQFILKNSLTEKQMSALEGIYDAIMDYKDALWNDVGEAHLSTWG